MRARVQNGYAVTAKVIGYKYKQTKTEGKVLVRDEPVASIIAEALEGFASGRFASQGEVQRFLEGQPDFPKQNHGGIRMQKVTDMLKHPIYAGYVRSKAWNVSLRKGRHEGLISFETHQKIQRRLEQKALAPARKDIDQDFPLRGFVTCGDCEKPLRSCWSKSGTGKRYAYYLCHTKNCPSYGKSIQRDKLEGEFSTLLKTMRPSAGLFTLVKAMVSDAWNQRAAQINETRKALRRDMLALEKQIDGFLNRLVDASSPATIKAYERKIEQLERDKLLAAEKLEHSLQPRVTAPQMIELSMRLLSNPWKIWENGDLALKKTVLRLAFAHPLPYHRDKGYRTPKTTLPFKVLEALDTQSCKMVRSRRLELPRVLPHSDLNAARLPIPPRPLVDTTPGRCGAFVYQIGFHGASALRCEKHMLRLYPLLTLARRRASGASPEDVTGLPSPTPRSVRPEGPPVQEQSAHCWPGFSHHLLRAPSIRSPRRDPCAKAGESASPTCRAPRKCRWRYCRIYPWVARSRSRMANLARFRLYERDAYPCDGRAPTSRVPDHHRGLVNKALTDLQNGRAR